MSSHGLWVERYRPQDLSTYVGNEHLKSKVERFLNDGLINIIGGCCGTTPEHIHAISKLASNYKPRLIDLT